MFVSIVIATRNRSVLLGQTLRALARQTWPADALEIIVSDNGSTDDTRDVVTSIEGAGCAVRYLSVPEPGKSHAVNAALRIARGDVIAFTDDDVQPEPGWIASLVRAFEETGADFVAGRIRPIWELAPPEWMSPALHGVLAIPDNGDVRLPIAKGDTNQVMPIGANTAIRASVLAQIGGLRTDLGKLNGSLRTGEDHELFLRLIHHGYRGVYEPGALVAHFVPASRLRRGYFRRWLYQNGGDVARIERRYPPPVSYWLGVPRYLWPEAVADLVSAIRATLSGDARRRFAKSLRLFWFAGYVGETWFGAGRAPEPATFAPAAPR
ncbi:MAG TPA: glycosyltransferase [Vicinamibacterales bacterium]